MAGPNFTETRVPLILSFLARFSSRDLDDFDDELLLSLSLSPLLLANRPGRERKEVVSKSKIVS
jgi:hypothetical protein